MPHRALVAVTVACLVGPLVPLAPAAADPLPTYVPPVDAPVLDPFRPPDDLFGPGNRGLEYGTEPGAEVRASADGTVTFAGAVAGARHVTVRHADGLRTSYSFLDRVDVVVGQRVSQGQVVGTTAGRLHLGARRDDAYLDPASLFATGPPRVELVPFDELPGAGDAGERSALRQLVGGVGGALGKAAEVVVDSALHGTGATVDHVREEGGQLLRTGLHYAQRISGWAQLDAVLRMWTTARAAAGRACTEPGAAVAPPTGRRVAVLVAGLGSTSESAAIDDVDTEGLGYAAPDVLRFSYEGGRAPDATDGLGEVTATTYGASATQVDLRRSAAHLADLVEDVAAASPGVPIDLYAHSQGGLVTRLALIELDRRHGPAWLERLGLVATLGTPHGGADLATAVYAIGSTSAGSAVLDVGAWALGLELDDDAPSSAQLAETSDVVAELRHHPIPAGIRAVSIAARGDLVVPVPSTRVPGAPQVVVPVVGISAHDRLPGSPEAQRELALALAGAPPTCTSFGSALVDQVVGEGVSMGEDLLGVLGTVVAARRGPPLGG